MTELNTSSYASSSDSNDNTGDMEWNWVIQPHEIKFEKLLGKGSFGSVYLGECRGLPVAVKVLHNQDIDPENIKKFSKEVELLVGIRCPSTVTFLGACLVQGKFMIITELVKGGELADLLFNKRIEISLYQRMKMAQDAAHGMCWLHEMEPKILHRDLKPSNMLVNLETMSIKLCDFGLACVKKGNEVVHSSGPIGTPVWMAPEVVTKNEYSEKSDVYSFGIILWQLLTRKDPFPHINSKIEMYKAISEDNIRPIMPTDIEYPKSLETLITTCWDRVPENRPTFKQILISLEDVLIDCAIKDEEGRCFWKEEFKHKEQVKWHKFWDKFSERIPTKDITEENVDCLSILLSLDAKPHYKDQAYVHIKNFGKLLDWFGPWEKLDPETYKNKPSLLAQIGDLCRNKWFFGEMNTQEANNALTDQHPGSFLLRFSSSQPGSFTLSRVDHKGKIVHTRIPHTENGYLCDGSHYPNITELVNSMNDICIYSCPGSKFAHIFSTQTVDGYKDNL